MTEYIMPICSQHTPMSFAEWELLPYQPGWKYEYWDGCAHITPNHQVAVTTAAVTPRQVKAPCPLRPVRSEDEGLLLALYMEAFADNQAFCDFTEERFVEAARRDLRESFRGHRGALLPASRVAVESEAAHAPPVGAALLSRDSGYGPVLDLIFIRPTWQRRGLATALAATAMNALYEAGEKTVTSCYQLANVASQAWHQGFGFVELPDLRYAQAYRRRAKQALLRHAQQGLLTAETRAPLEAALHFWQQRVEALEQLMQTQGFEAATPRLPHW